MELASRVNDRAATYQQPPRVGGRERVKSCGDKRAGVLRRLSVSRSCSSWDVVRGADRDRGDVAEVEAEGAISGECSGEEVRLSLLAEDSAVVIKAMSRARMFGRETGCISSRCCARRRMER